MTEFQQDLQKLINKTSQENASNTPDFILAEYMQKCLEAFNHAVKAREKWYDKENKISEQ